MAATSKMTHSGWLVPKMHTGWPGSTPRAISPLAAARTWEAYSAQVVVTQRWPSRTAYTTAWSRSAPAFRILWTTDSNTTAASRS